MNNTNFLFEDKLTWESPSEGVNRQIMGYNSDLMMVKISFEKGAIGAIHSHQHSQSSYVVSGKFEVEIAGKKSVLNSGDGFFVDPNIQHGVICLESGILIDTFAPMREDFI